MTKPLTVAQIERRIRKASKQLATSFRPRAAVLAEISELRRQLVAAKMGAV